MADLKITQLPAIVGADVHNDDVFVLVDTSADITKKITRTELQNVIELGLLDNVNITGGLINGTVIGNNAAAAITGTTITGTTITGTALQIDNININGNAITSTAGTDLTISPLGGQQIVLDGTIVIDAGVVTGATSITSTAFTGNITGNVTGNVAGNVTSSGTSTFATVDINGGAIDATTIGSSTPSTGAFTTASTTGLATLASVNIDGGNVDGTVIGAATPAAITGTTVGGTVITASTNFAGNITGNVTGNVNGTIGAGTATTGAFTTISGGNTTLTGYLRGPSTFTIDPATHGDNTGTVVIAGNLTVNGTTTTVNSETLNVVDKQITVAFGAANAAAANGAGIKVDGADAILSYDSTNDRFTMNKSLASNLVGNVTGNVTGNTSGTAATVTGAAQTNITSVGTLTALTVDNINLNGNTIVSSTGTLAIDDNVTVNGAMTATTVVGTITTAAQANITSVGSLTALTVTGEITANGGIALGDNDKATFGAGDDLQIYHDGSASYIDDAGTGNLNLRADGLGIDFYDTTNSQYYTRMARAGAVSLYHNGSAKFATTATGIDVTGVITTDGMTTSADINFGDNDKAIFGAGSDLQIYHDGSNSIIDDSGTGNLYIRSNDILLDKYTGERMIRAIGDGAVTLYYDNAAKIATTATGIDVTGSVLADGLNVDGTATIDGGGTGNVHVNIVDSSLCPTMTFTRNGGGTITNAFMKFVNSGGQVAEINSDGGGYFLRNVGIGEAAPLDKLHVYEASNSAVATQLLLQNEGSGNHSAGIAFQVSSSGETTAFAPKAGIVFERTGANGRGPIKFFNDVVNDANGFSAGDERMRIDDNYGYVGIGTTAPLGNLSVEGGGRLITIGDSGTTNIPEIKATNTAGDGEAFLKISAYEHRLYTGGTQRLTINNAGAVGIGTISPQAELHLSTASSPEIRLTDTTNSVEANFYTNDSLGSVGSKSNHPFIIGTNNTERMRITSAGAVLVGKTSTALTSAGVAIEANGIVGIGTNTDVPMYINRQGNDGTLIELRQGNTAEGTISVSGTTVSYNGGHLARWSQLADNTRDDTILKGTVLTNLDQMAVWGDEDNEQLNCMAKSSVEGDANVAGVFVNWDNDDDVYTNDMNVAMTGDMIIRIAQGTTVARGDLLMSAGDGTAKPQGDDSVRSKTIAKVTSTHTTCTYDDGSYCVPCVLMAC